MYVRIYMYMYTDVDRQCTVHSNTCMYMYMYIHVHTLALISELCFRSSCITFVLPALAAICSSVLLLCFLCSCSKIYMYMYVNIIIGAKELQIVVKDV